MDHASLSQRLSRIETLWTLVRKAAGGPDNADRAAQEALCRRYSGVVHRYLLGAVRDEQIADELYQEFWLRFLRGYFRNADPERGRFRSLLKSALFNLVTDHHNKRKRGEAQGQALGEEIEELAVVSDPDTADREFVRSCRDELLERAWMALAELQQKTQQPYFDVLRLRAEQPDLTSDGMAEKLSGRWGKAVTAVNARKVLSRAREKFAELLVREVSLSMENPTDDEITQEIADLGLLSYCKSALQKRQDS